jgi:haloalkane dehalogenase
MVTPMVKIPDWLSKLYPFDPKVFITPSGAAMSFVDEGPRSDEAVLMLHGNPTWSFFYRRLITRLAPFVRCVAPDHIGMGLSQKPRDYDYTLGTRISDIEALVASLGLRRVHLVVHDWGGAIGFGVATANPDLIGKITILNTAAFTSVRIPRRISLCRWPMIGEAIVRGLNGFAGPATRMAMHNRKLTPDERRGFLLPYDSWANRVAVNAFVRDIPVEEGHRSRSVLIGIEERLGRLSAHDKLIVWGGRDFCFDGQFLERWRAIYPDAEVNLLRDAGHYVLEDRNEEVCSLISDFIIRRRL